MGQHLFFLLLLIKNVIGITEVPLDVAFKNQNLLNLFGLEDFGTTSFPYVIENQRLRLADDGGTLIMTSDACSPYAIIGDCPQYWLYEMDNDQIVRSDPNNLLIISVGTLPLSAGSPLVLSTVELQWLFDRNTGMWMPLDDQTLCVTYTSGPDTMTLETCDGSIGQIWTFTLEMPFTLFYCFFVEFLDQCLIKDCSSVGGCAETCGDSCYDEECRDVEDSTSSGDGPFGPIIGPFDPCCSCDPDTQSCDIPSNPALSQGCVTCTVPDTCNPNEVYLCDDGCAPDPCFGLNCPDGTGCYTAFDIQPPLVATCTPNPCDAFKCTVPNSECVLVGQPGGDIVPWCQCKQDYEPVCMNDFGAATGNTIYVGHILDNLYGIDRIECASKCIDKKKCGAWSFHENQSRWFGHCKLFSKWGVQKRRSRRGWMISWVGFDADAVRAGEGNLAGGPSPVVFSAAVIFGAFDAITHWKYRNVYDFDVTLPSAGMDVSQLGSILRGAAWKINGTEPLNANYLPPTGTPDGRKLDENKLLLLEDNTDELPHEGSCAPHNGADSCNHGDESCYCDSDCVEIGDCCPDYKQYCAKIHDVARKTSGKGN